jgi:ribosomal protein S18 acetylase RimI-like enzyme
MAETLALPALPGYSFRHMQGEADLPAIVAVLSACEAAAGFENLMSLEQVINFYRHLTNCDPARDTLLVERAQGLAAYGRVDWRRLEGQAVYLYSLAHHVLLEHWQGELAAILLRWLEDRCRQVAIESQQEHAFLALLEAHGYRPVRYFCKMERPNLDDIQDAPLPPGLEVRPVQPEHLRAIWDANVEAFRDHWGVSEVTETDYERFISDPVQFQPDVWKVAWDTDSGEVVGMVLGFINHADNAANNRKLGWTENICVRRPWRRQGVAHALIAENLRELKARGMAYAALGVDTDNPTGALRVYESMGFRPVQRNTVFQKPMWQ